MKVPIIAPPYEARSRAQSLAQLKNWFLVDNPADQEEDPYILYPTPGLVSWVTATGGSPIRQMFEHQGLLYVVAANKFYSISTAKVQTLLGTLNTSTGRISIAAIADEILLADGADGYHYKVSTTTFSTVTDVDFPVDTKVVTAQDEYFMAATPSSGRFFLSALSNGLSWLAADFSTAEGKPDYLVSMYSHRRYLWLFGEYTTEIWYNSANIDFPFEKQNGIFIEYGIVGEYAVVEAGNALFWVGRNRNGSPVILKSNGFQPQIVSTTAINYQLSTYSSVSDAYAFSYSQEGHEFVLFNFPTANKTWVYDVSTELWHERDSYVNGSYDYYLGNCSAFFDNKILIGDRNSDQIYELDMDTYTENGNQIRRKLISSNIDLDLRRGSMYNFQVKLDPGIGIESGQGSDPQLMLRVSKDYGNTWGNELWRSPGKLGEYRDRALWTRLGEGRVFTFELTATDPNKWIIHGARADVELTAD